jgi:hypothetical protein
MKAENSPGNMTARKHLITVAKIPQVSGKIPGRAAIDARPNGQEN